MLYKGLVLTLTIVIIYLLIINADVFKEVVKVVSDQFNQTFKAVTTAEEF